MILKKEEWNEVDFNNFHNYISSLKEDDKKIDFETKIVNSKMQCLGIPCNIINNIVKEIHSGNYMSFLLVAKMVDYPTSLIIGKLITKITDFQIFKQLLDRYSTKADCWALTDIFNLNVKKLGKQNLKKLVLIYIKSTLTFRRRIAIIILLKNFVNEFDIHFAFDIINSMYKEKEYYVNMSIAWFLCERFIKQRDATLYFIKSNKLNNFVLNKFVLKCGDSFRISNEDKNLLKTFKNCN